MSRTRKVISSEMEKYSEVKSRLQSELADLQGKEQTLLGRIGDELLSGSNQASKDLLELRISRDIKLRELEIAGSKLSGLQRELDDITLAESTTPWSTFEAGLPVRIKKVRAGLGEVRLELNNLERELGSLSSPAAKTSQEASIVAGSLLRVCSTGSKQLFEILKDLEHIEGIINKSHAK